MTRRIDPGRLCFMMVLLCSGPFARHAFAQGADVGVTAAALVSIQPANDDFVGPPYLDQGLGGVAPGFGAGLSVVTPGGLVATGEFTMAFFEVEQEGRLVDGGHATGRLRDSLLSGLIGYALSGNGSRLQFAGGVSWLLDSPTQNDISILGESGNNDVLLEGHRRLAFTSGADFLQRLSPGLSFVVTGRYSKLSRSRRADELGIGSHIFRAGAGPRLRLTR